MRTLLFIVAAIGTLAILQMCMFAKTANYYKDTINERVYKTHNQNCRCGSECPRSTEYLEQHN